MGNQKGSDRGRAPRGSLTRRQMLRDTGAVALVAGLFAGGVRPARGDGGKPGRFAITARDFRFEFPATIPGGYTEITLKNEGSASHHAMLMRLNPGIGFTDFMDRTKAANAGPLFSVSRSVGGPGSVDRGQQASVVIDLAPGQYAVICMVPGPDGMPHYRMGMAAPLTVTAPVRPGVPPVGTTTIDMSDFAFGHLPDVVRAGRHLWKVVDTGRQLHEMVINRLSPGVTFEQARAMLASSEGASAPSGAQPAPAPTGVPFVGVAGVAPMSPGETNWAIVDLTPGDYFAVCYIPDVKTGAPHFALGMIAPFTVKA